MSQYYVCWKKNGLIDCTIFCMNLQEAMKIKSEKEKEGVKTVLENCFISPQMFYGHIVSIIKASKKL
jgi:ribosomal protein S19